MAGFITLEGIEGAGKSTLRSHLAELTRDLNKEVIITREPGATAFGQAIRSMVLDPKNTSLCALAELMLFQADRAQHVEEVIRPALERGALVICDRYLHSTLAYQGYGRGLDIQSLKSITHFATGGLLPDLTILLDLDPSIGLERARTRVRKSTGSFNVQDITTQADSEQNDRFEEQPLEFHQAIRNGFLELAADPQYNFVVIDANKSPEQISSEAKESIKKALRL
jgi:dTMP kinase